MNIQAQVSARTRKIGALLRDSRLVASKSIDDCALAIGISRTTYKSYEEGRRAPTLPEVEALAYYLNLPLHLLLSKESILKENPRTTNLNLPAIIGVRQRIISVLLRQEREKTNISLRVLSEQSGISITRLKSYESGERPIPLSELEVLVSILGGQIETFSDQTGPIGQRISVQKAINEFKQLPPEVQNFIRKPINRPYLELAIKLSNLSTDKLRSIAEGILDITL